MFNKNKKILTSIFYTTGIFFLFFILYFYIKDYNKAVDINREISDLNKEIEFLENENVRLAELIKFFDSEAYAEQKARMELGLMKEGENLVIIPNKTDTNESSKSDEEMKAQSNNTSRWFQYFFGK